MHRRPNQNVWEANMPFEVQQLFWDYVLLPAVNKHVSVGAAAYFPNKVHDTTLKAASKHRRCGIHYHPKAVPVQPDELKRIQEEMRQTIATDPSLAMFGSFYFILDGKNLKLQTGMALPTLCPQTHPLKMLEDA